MPLKESGEMYLESIYVLCREKGTVRSVDVAEYMNYSKPSVSRAVSLLKRQNYIVVDADGHITLTKEGEALAQNIFERHTVLTRILTAIGVDEATAAEDACRIEHVISETSFHAMKQYIEKAESKPF